MIQGLFLFDVADKSNPKTILRETQQIISELKTVGLNYNTYPISTTTIREQMLASKPTSNSIKTIQESYQLGHYDLASIGPQYSNNYKEVKRRNSQLHWHRAPETRLFLNGGGCFGIFTEEWLGICLLTAGCSIQIPKETYHWFDYGNIDPKSPPEYDVVRFWKSSEVVKSSMEPHPATDVGNPVEWIHPFPTYDTLKKMLSLNS